MRMRSMVLAAAAIVATCAYWAWTQTTVHSQSLPPAPEGQQFRIVVGLTDTEAKNWKGAISVTNGELLSLAGWRFTGDDKAESNGDFSFKTKVGLLENQLRPGELYGQTGFGTQDYRHLIPQGLLLKLRGSGPARVAFQSDSGNFSFSTEAIQYGERASFLEGNASVERMPVEQKLSESGPADDYPAIGIAEDGKRWVAWLSYRNKSDGVMVSDGSKVYPVGQRGDLHAPAIASDGKGAIHVVWPRNENGTFRLYESTFHKGKWSNAKALTQDRGSNFWPQLASDGNGRLALVWQGFRNNQSVILARLWDGKRWSPEKAVSEGPGNCWAPVAAYGGGKLWMAWDSYQTGAYQIYAREWGGGVTRITKGAQFSVRPSIFVTNAGKPVVAFEESDALWGKDFAYQMDRRGTVEYKNRRIRVATLDSGDWKELRAPVADAIPPEMRRYIQQPQIALDSAGHLYMSLRCRTSTRVSRIDFWAANGRWETFLTHLDGNRWTPAIPMPTSVGRNGMRAPIALDRGQVYIVWPTDGRLWMADAYQELDVYATALPVGGAAASLDGVRAIVAEESAPNPNPNEPEDVRRIREYRYNAGGKQYRILRGDFHRHTELSQDGAGDGMLEDNYRYTLDAASMDIGFVSDHQMGINEEYNWWMTQKSNDLYTMPQRYVPMYGYERSVPYPNGHRNVIWAERGQPVLRIGPAEMQGKENTGHLIYPYLRQTNGIATSHTSATAQGTDWRDNDPALEPVVEIYQGYDANYEEPNAPRAWKPGQTQSHERNEPAGYVWNAWAKGYKLGVQSSSDHVSTHTSYACVLAEQFTRQGILDALRKRHTYAATDNIVMDFRIGDSIMGDIADATAPPKLEVHILGSAPLKQIDVVKNNRYIHKVSPMKNEERFEYQDMAIEKGESYYYVRVEQTDGQLAWSSPIWIRYQPK